MAENDPTGCWVDVFELSRFRGRRRRLFGPSDFRSLRNQAGLWGVGIDSIIVGPAAYLRLYRSNEPTSAALWMTPKQLAEDLIALQIDDEVDSLSLHKHPPQPGEAGIEHLQRIMSPQNPQA